MRELTPEEQAMLDDMVDSENEEARRKSEFKMTKDIQRRILSMLLRDDQMLARNRSIVQPQYFENEVHKTVCRILFAHYDKYVARPTLDVLGYELRQRIEGKDAKTTLYYLGELSIVHDYYVPGLDEYQYLYDLVIEFVKEQKLKVAYFTTLDMFKEDAEDKWPKIYGMLNNAMDVGLEENEDGYLIEELVNLPAVEWQVDQFWPTKGFVCLYGPYGCGKSFVSLDAGLCIATGKPYLDKFPVKQGAVCYIAAEGSEGVLPRIQAWMKHYGQPVSDNFLVLPQAYNFLDSTTPRQILQVCEKRLGEVPDIVFIDTLNRNMPGGDENSSKDMGQYVTNVASLVAAGPTVVSIHHTGKDKSRGPRGHVSFPAACNSIIALDGKPCEGTLVACNKQKDSSEFDGFYLEQKVIDLDDRTEGSLVLLAGDSAKDRRRGAVEAKQNKNEAALLEAIPQTTKAKVEESGGAQATTKKQLETLLGWNRNKVSSVINSLHARQALSRAKLSQSPTSPEYFWQEKLLCQTA